MKPHEFLLCLILGLSIYIAGKVTDENRTQSDLNALTGETIQSLKDKLKECEKANQGACELYLGVKVKGKSHYFAHGDESSEVSQ